MNQEQFAQRIQGELVMLSLESQERCQRKCNDSVFKQNFSSDEECLNTCSNIDIMGWGEARKFWRHMTIARR
jgi:hypothetical protein